MDEWVQEWGLWGLFASAFVSSTLFPGGSEVVLLALALEKTHAVSTLFVVATVGNVIGGMTSWGIGRWLAVRFPGRRLTHPRQQAVLRQLQRWGSPLLLLSWLPVIGDPLCLVAGWLRINPWLALLFTAIGRGCRYAVLLLWV